MRRLLPVLLILPLVACGSSSPISSPSPVPTPIPQPAPPPATPFQGVWAGQWTQTQCTENGSGAAGGCAQFPTSGGLIVTLTQSGATAQGTVAIGALQMAASGPISDAGDLALTGQAHQSGATSNLTSWRTSISGNVMVGTFTYILAPDDTSFGSLTIRANLQGVVKQ